MSQSLEHSRVLLLGTRSSDIPESELESALNRSVTAVTIQGDSSGAIETAALLLGMLRRMPGHVVIVDRSLPPGIASELARSVDRIAPDNPVSVRSAEPKDATARIHVGATGHGPNAIRVVPEGYGAHLLADPAETLAVSRSPNRLGCMFAAALGASEAFSANAQVRPHRRRQATHISFCPVSLTSDLYAAPDLTARTLDLALVGCGAIGTAMAVIISGLPFTGRLLAADRQVFQLENVGTYSLGTMDEVHNRVPKVNVVEACLHGFEVIAVHGELADLPGLATAGSIPWPKLMLCGLDSPEARRTAQRLWPDRLFDAATGDTTVGVHDTYPTGPCIECVFPLNTGGPSALERLADATGLSISILGRDEPLTEADLVGVPLDKRQRLLEHIGAPKCALAKAYGLTDLGADGYRPSVAFVSAQAACLGVGALIAHLIGIERPTLFQCDALRGPHLAIAEHLVPRPDCYCQRHRTRVAAVRASRIPSSGLEARYQR